VSTTATERKLLIGGEWVETGEWIEVRSPYDGALVGRVPKAGGAETRHALDAAVLGFTHPATGERLNFAKELPPFMSRLARSLEPM